MNEKVNIYEYQLKGRVYELNCKYVFVYVIFAIFVNAEPINFMRVNMNIYKMNM